MSPKHWTIFILLGAIWSASFLWIKIALAELGPLTLVAYRTGFGLLTGLLVASIWRIPFPRDWKTWRMFILLGFTNIAIPFFLITWGQQSIDSAVASILNATVPLFTIVIAHFFLPDDKITAPKVLGLLIGFSGVAILLSRGINDRAHNSLIGQAAVILAAVSYAISYVYARRNTQQVPGEIRGVLPLVSASLVMGIIAPIAESPFKIPQLPITWIGLLWLGALGTGLAFIMQYYLIHEIGPTRATLVTYIFPLGGVLLGVLFLREPLSWQLAVGAALIISSIAVVNWKKK
ncbi:MAG: DMT family transporter [Chloroflexi bacterium]|nr:MAG: DMT family transporter [Chloroflexota bacterium]